MNWEGWHKINDIVQDAVQAIDHSTMFLHMSLDLPEESEVYSSLYNLPSSLFNPKFSKKTENLRLLKFMLQLLGIFLYILNPICYRYSQKL